VTEEVSNYDKLMQARALTIRTGAIHEFQLHQLKRYPYFLEGVVKFTLRINPDEKLVEYRLTGWNKAALKKESALADFANIKKCVQQLLWPETTLIFKGDKKVLYDSRK
jgi:hypothetical protein